MRNVSAHDVDTLPGRFLAVGNAYVADEHVARHRHRRAQFLYSARGVAVVLTDLGSWLVPPGRAVWIPSGVTHELVALTGVELLNLYVDADVALHLPPACRVVGVSALASELLEAAVEAPRAYELGSRTDLILSLLLHEIGRAPELPLNVPLPKDARLVARCRQYLMRPSPHETIDDWCLDLAMSRRSFTRRFRVETGLSFAAWCRQACLFTALPRLAAGEPITTVAFDLGYESASAFATMFKRTVGVPPSRYLERPHPGH